MNADGDPTTTPTLQVSDLRVTFDTERGPIDVVDDISFSLSAGETLGLVGESGSGKSVTALSIMGLLPARIARITRGTILVNGVDVAGLGRSQLNAMRGNTMSMVFQEPMTSLDPAFKVGEQIASSARRHWGLSKRAAWERAAEMLDLVGIPDARRRVHDYPHTFSGGMRQRVMIAIALACEPEVLIADEPTTALDVTIQAQVLELLAELQEKMGMSILLVTHDLGVVSEICDRVIVMYAGQAVETGAGTDIFASPQHPYTEGLLGCLPSERIGQELRPIRGVVPPPGTMPPGCRFHPRCEYAVGGLCDTELIELTAAPSGHLTRCARTGDLALQGVAT